MNKESLFFGFKLFKCIRFLGLLVLFATLILVPFLIEDSSNESAFYDNKISVQGTVTDNTEVDHWSGSRTSFPTTLYIPTFKFQTPEGKDVIIKASFSESSPLMPGSVMKLAYDKRYPDTVILDRSTRYGDGTYSDIFLIVCGLIVSIFCFLFSIEIKNRKAK